MAKHGRSGKARKTDGGFKLDGKKFDTSCTTLGAKRVLDFLDGMKKGELLSSEELAVKVKIAKKYLSAIALVSQVNPYKQIVRFPTRMLVWGSRQTIAGLRTNHKEILA